MSTLRINCAVFGWPKFCIISIPQSTQVDDLKNLLKERQPHDLGHIDAWNFILWKPKDSNPIVVKPSKTLVERIGRLGSNLSEFADELEPCDDLLNIFPTQPPKDQLHIILQVPPAIPYKRELPISEDLYERTKRSKIIKNSPSSTGKPSFFRSLQKDPSERILNDFPKPDSDIAPVALLYEGFGHFLDIIDGRTDVPGLADVEFARLHSEVDEFASQMNQDYNHEHDRRDAVLLCLNRIFKACRGITIPSLHAAAIGSVNSDGHNVADHGAGTMVVKFKNGISGINAVPEVELTGVVAHLNVKGMEAHHQLYLGWRVPCLGLIIVGHRIQFYAVITVDHRLKLVSLTPMYLSLDTASDGRDRKALYLAFAAALVFQAQVLRDIEKRLNNPPPALPTHRRRFPAISKLRKYPPSDDYLLFEIQDIFQERQSYRFLYVAETPTGQFVLIKFARQYSIHLHDICAKSGHAPKILAFERLPGGWYAVAMEYIEFGDTINRSAQLADHRHRWARELWALMKTFHSKGFVHGDLRDANILCQGETVMLIDFDWGGIEGSVSYPTGNLNPELLEGRVSNDLIITKGDDERVLKRTLEKLEEVVLFPHSLIVG